MTNKSGSISTGNTFLRVLEAIVIAAIIGSMTMFGTTQAVSAKIDYIRNDLVDLRNIVVGHIQTTDKCDTREINK
jgi:hypothetical protein